jgi:heme-degrading monooxygenase HmoA
MPIAVVYSPPAVTEETYKGLWASGSPMPDAEGLLFHAGVGEGDDFFTISVWESREAYDAFSSGFKEAVGTAGFEGGAPKILPVHHTIDHGVPA